MIKSVLAAVGAAIAGVAIYANLPLRYTLPVRRLDLKSLASASLQNLQNNEKFEAGKLWQHNGVVVMAVRRPGWLLCREEASELSSFKKQFEESQFSLVALVHERFGVNGFQPYFKGEIFLDTEKRFFGGADRRWMSAWHGFLRPSVWLNGLRAKRAGFDGDMKGEGRILGGVFVIGSGDKGLLYEHYESEFGEHADMDAILKAVKSSNA